MEVTEKRCTKCGIVKPIGEFTKRKASNDGHNKLCKNCTRSMVRLSAHSNVKKHNDEFINNIEKMGYKKTCNKCGISKPISQFHVLRQRIDGHDETCIDCRKIKYKSQVESMTPDRIEQIAKNQPIKRCSQCGIHKPIEEFPLCLENTDGRAFYCNQCKETKMQEYYKNTLNYRIEYRNGHKEDSSRRYRSFNVRLKIEVLSHYGNGKCACVICNEYRLPCLSIDHINGNGSRHRKEIKCSGVKFYKWLKDNNYPEGYQTLCMNCQFIKAFDMRHKNIDKDLLTII